jgi:hypothetical protein
LLVVVGVPGSARLVGAAGPQQQEGATVEASPALPVVSKGSFEPPGRQPDPTGGRWAPYEEIQSQARPSLTPYAINPSELSNLASVAEAAKIEFDAAKLAALQQPGFFLQPTRPAPTDPNGPIHIRSRVDDMIDLYARFGGPIAEWERAPENAVFVTTDLLLHTFHLLIDRSFQKIEADKFRPALKELTQGLLLDSVTAYRSEPDRDLKESLKRLSAFYLVPSAILDSSVAKPKRYSSPEEEQRFATEDAQADTSENVKSNMDKYRAWVPPEVVLLAGEELDLVLRAEGRTVSPIFGRFGPLEDYSQYEPRGHYTGNSMLRSLFRAMTWYGRGPFSVASPDLTRDAAIVTLQLGSLRINDKSASALWESIYLPTEFFVGQSDDLSFYDYSRLMLNIYGRDVTLGSLREQDKLQQLQAAADGLVGPSIGKQAGKAFKFMGQRFIPDSYMLASFTEQDAPAVLETGQPLPSTPTALMVMSVLGSDAAEGLLNDWIKTNAPASDRAIGAVKSSLRAEFRSYDQGTWTQNLYWGWLYNLLPLFAEHRDGYPMFMRGSPWVKKSLVTALGSWTELRHDTLLYAKQSFAERGGGDRLEPRPVPKGYVEPNLPVLTRLIALNNMTKEGLLRLGLIDPEQEGKFERFGTALEFFKGLAEKELSDSVISDEEYERLRIVVGLAFPSIVWPAGVDLMTERDARMGLIADVHTDFLQGKVLYEAIGAPSIIYVAVKDRGGARLTRGAVYSYYEFTEPLGSRLTDEEWQVGIYEGGNTRVPAPPAWTHELPTWIE